MNSSSVFLAYSLNEFRRLKDLAERAFAQVDDVGFFAAADPESNSIAIIVKHMAGNMRSRWTDFLTTDGEKPDRHRDTEFVVDDEEGREKLMERWEAGWRVLFGVMESLASDDLERTITIRGEALSVIQAVIRQISHYAYHVGQIVYLARDICGPEWHSLSIPRGKSEEFTRKLKEG